MRNRHSFLVWPAAVALLAVAHPVAWSQEAEPAAPQMVNAGRGVVVASVMMQADGAMKVGPVEIAGQSPDDLFTYWIGTDSDGNYYGYDLYTGVWMPGPVTYRRAMLEFQDEMVEGWIRIFAGMPDYRRFFSGDGILYERYQNFFRGDHIYTYYVDMTTGERSDASDFINFLSGNQQWLNILVEQQRIQAEEIRNRADLLGLEYCNWQQGAQVPPAVVMTFDQAIPEIILPDSIADESEPSLLELIEEELTTTGAGSAENPPDTPQAGDRQ